MEPKIYRATMADPVKMEELTGQKIHPAYYKIEPQGCRLLVVIEEVPEKTGLLHLPSQGHEKMGVGYVMGVGPFCGTTLPHGGPSPVGMVTEDGLSLANLLYAHVIIGQIRGMPITVSFNRDYPAQVVVIDEREIKCVDFDPTPMAVRAERGE
jgi:hypothetical protein